MSGTEDTSKRIVQLETELKQVKQEFEDYIYIVSHDLSAPIRHAQGFTQLMLEKDGEKLSEASQRHMKIVLDACEKGQGMLDGLLLFSRVHTSTEKATTFSSDDVMSIVIDLFSFVMQNTGAVVTKDALPQVTAVQSQIQTVFQALLSNALTYMKEGVAPEVHITCADKGRFFEYSVSDNGIGIPEKMHEKIFQPLRRGVGEGDYHGIGMGLAISRRIARRHGGDIRVESKEGEGSTFYFTLPKESTLV